MRCTTERLRGSGPAAGEGGFTVIEVMVGATLAAIGLIAVAGSLDVFRTLMTKAAAKEAATHVAEREIDRLRALGWSKLMMTAAPGTSTDPRHPLYLVTAGSPTTYKPSSDAEAQPVVLDQNGATEPNAAVDPGPTPWQSEGAQGQIYRFVTKDDDGLCGSACPGTDDNRRVTVAVTVESAHGPKEPITASTVVVDPTVNPGGDVAENPNVLPPRLPGAATDVFYLYDTTASASYSATSSSHATRSTGATSDVPDRMGTALPSTPSPSPAPLLAYKYSNELETGQPVSGYPGGLVLRESTSGCSGTAATQRHLWVAPAYGGARRVTGIGGATLYGQTVGGASGKVKVCVGVYRLILDGLSRITTKTQLGTTQSYDLPSWPTDPTAVSFPFSYLNGNYPVVATTERLAVQVTVDAASERDLVLLYDHPDYPTSVQLETAP